MAIKMLKVELICFNVAQTFRFFLKKKHSEQM